MAYKFRICLAQINTTVGDIEGNSKKIIEYINKAKWISADIVVFPELSLCGYPPEDLLLKPHFIKRNEKYLKRVIRSSDSIFSVVGFPYQHQGKLFNGAALIYNRKLYGVYKKVYLPNYGVFDEMRYFKPGGTYPVITLADGIRIGVNICEDIWYPDGPQRTQAIVGKANIIINISSSPYYAQKINTRQKTLSQRARENSAFIFYCNSVGGQDELVFDGASMVFDRNGRVIARAKQFEEDFLIVDVDYSNFGIDTRQKKSKDVEYINMPFVSRAKDSFKPRRIEQLLKPLDEIYMALTVGLRDYVTKNGFKKIVLGLSGGIDSALVAALACDALGQENVIAVSLPSMYSSKGTKLDAKRLAKNLGIKLLVIPINNIYKGYLKTLTKPLRGTKSNITEENIQARIRGNLLMALSNKFGWLVVTTGNKSELSVGYCTLYGDTAGGFALIKDVPKTVVYKLAQFRNAKEKKEFIPKNIFLRAPSAELKKGQTDQDTLPPYPKLDKIIDAYIERDKSASWIIDKGLSKQVVKNIISMIDRNEYKRRQSPIGIKITPKAFGKDRRMPITNKFYE